MPIIYPSRDNTIVKSAASWAAARDASSGTVTTDGGSILYVRARNSPSYIVGRTYMTFDTSAISVTPASATLNLHGYNQSGTAVYFVQASSSMTGGVSSAFVASDFSKIQGFVTGSSMSGNAVELAPSVAKASWNTSSNNVITLNATALGLISSQSELTFVILSSFDFFNTSPSSNKITNFRSVEQGSGERPYLSYVAGSSGKASKTFSKKARRRGRALIKTGARSAGGALTGVEED